MNVATPIIADQPSGVSVSQDGEGLARFLDPACAAVIWNREVPLDVVTWLAALNSAFLPNTRMVLRPSGVRDAVREHCESAGTPKGPRCDWLVDDIARLAEQFAAMMDVEFVRLRLQAVTTNACRKFHLDAITGRLLCTYRGRGTEYGTSLDKEDPDRIYSAPTGAPILLRGSLWPTSPAANLLHRSPTIEGTGETRLVLVLDPILDPNEAA